MNVQSWLRKPEVGFDLLRVYLGVGLVVRAVLFLGDPTLLGRVIDNESWFAASALAHVVALSHLVGGMLLAAGCYTRLAAALQIPSLAGAVFFVHLEEGLFSRGQSLELAALVLFVLVLYALFGAGPLSVDRYLDRAQLDDTASTVLAPPKPRDAGLPQGRATTVVNAAEPPGDWGPSSGAHLEPPVDSAEAAFQYRDLKAELTSVAVVLTVLIALLASAQYVWAVMWFVIAFIMFGVWRIGRAQFQ
jgi:uncharacterized membrane protein YphA (DoxX/SURF4 family)